MAALTAKQKCFVDEYLIDLNATQAAIRAGYSPKTADEIAHQNLGKLDIQRRIQERMDARSKRTGITQDQVLAELLKLAYSNGSDFAKVVTKPRVRRVFNEETQEYEERQVEEQYVELVDTDSLPADKRAAIASIKETRYGIEVSTCDKLKALELLGKHLGMFTDKLKIEASVTTKTEPLTVEEKLTLVREAAELYGKGGD